MWVKILPYFGAAVVLIGLEIFIDNRGYNRGHGDAEKTCRETTVPAARAEERKACDKNATVTVETCDALRHSNANAAATIDRLRKQYGECATVPLAEGSLANDGASRDGVPVVRIGAIAEAERKNGIQVGSLKACQLWVKSVCDANEGQCYSKAP